MTDVKIEAVPVAEVAPEVPTSEPPVDVVSVAVDLVAEEKPAEEVIPADGAEAAAAPAAAATAAVAAPEEKKEKKSGGVARRFTFTKKWGKHRDEAVVPKEPEAPKDAKEDVLGWLAQQIPQAVHKANYQVLDYVQKTAVENEEERKTIPGKDQSTTRNQFLSFIRDGDLLVKFANSLQPGAVEPVVAEENADAAAQKEVQKKNLDSFAEWANGVIGHEGLKSEDLLEKGKAGYSAVFQTLWQLGLQAKEKFEKDGFDAETIVTLAGQAVKSGLLTTILGFFRRNRQPTVEEQKEGETGEGAAAAAAVPEGDKPAETDAGIASVEEVVEEPIAVKVETSAPAAVAAN